MYTETMYEMTECEPEGRRMSPLAAFLMIAGTCLALWSVIVTAAVHVL